MLATTATCELRGPGIVASRRADVSATLRGAGGRKRFRPIVSSWITLPAI